MDKTQIMDIAREIGTFETSIQPYEDCCTVFLPKHPVTKPKLEKILESEGIPRCERCGGVVKPWVVLYGEAPDKYTLMGATREIAHADALIVAGTSLSVEPAASLLMHFSGDELVVINREPTPADARATLLLRGEVAEIMGKLNV